MDAGKPLAALVYLALAPKQKVDRDHLAELLWPGCDRSDARHSLRQSLYRLREAANGTPVIRIRGTAVELLSGIRVDCLELERRVEAGDGADELLQGNFLEGFAIPESKEFESWAEAQRVRFRELRGEIARRIAERHLAAGDSARALEAAEHLAALKPFSDAPMRLVMEALARGGRHATALARYHAYVELLKQEVEDRPGKDLAGYAEELGTYLKSRPEVGIGELPFVGRAAQWSALEAAWQSARRGEGRTLLVEGAAGQGKTRLLAELARRVRAAGGLVLPAKCYEIQRTVPYGAIAEALGPCVARAELGELNSAWLGEAARLLPELSERFPNLPKPADSGSGEAGKRRMHHAAARCIDAVARSAPMLLTVDDVHWGDAPSIEVLHLLSHRLRAAPVLIAVTYRPAELTPVARQFARSLSAERAAQLVALDPLRVDDVAELLSTLGQFDGVTLRDTVAAHLQRHSAGNPLFLGELLAALERGQLLNVRDGRWQFASATAIQDLPHTLGKLLADRIEPLLPWMRASVESLAVAATETAIEVVAGALDMSEPRAELALSVLEEERLVKRGAAGMVELIHDELQRLVYQGIPDERRRLLHGAIGSALESHGEAKRPGGAARLAYHFDQAGDRERAHQYALSAASEAGALSAPDAEQAHLVLAAAHSPRALPPTSSAGRSPSRVSWPLVRRLRRRPVVVAGLSALALLGLMGALYLRENITSFVSTLSLRQGRLLFASGAMIGGTHELRWGVPGFAGRVVAMSHQPTAMPLGLVSLSVQDRGERHNKVFSLRGQDTSQLTFGLSDDNPAGWSPDGRLITIERGWKADRRRYQQNIFLLDSSGRIVHQLTNSKYQDQSATWSPTGTRLAFVRDSVATWTVWDCDADGTHCDDISTRFRLSNTPHRLAFSPDGRLLAAASAQSAVLNVIDLAADAAAVVRFPVDSLDGAPVWSPDGKWVVFLVHARGRAELRAIPANGATGSRLVAVVPADVHPTAWTGGPSRLVQRVGIEPRSLRLRVGVGARAAIRVTSADGTTVKSAVRWSLADTTIAVVDDLGFVRGRTAGATLLVASAGGFRADTIPVTVTGAHVDTLLVEDWSGGLDSTRWTSFGSPRPLVVRGPRNRAVFWNHGDYNHGSGAVSVTQFSVGAEGLTVEVEAWVGFNGGHWQFWAVSLVDRASGIDERGDGDLPLRLIGNNPTQVTPMWTCMGGERSGSLAGEFIDRRWRRFAIEFRPDGRAECYVDGRLLSTADVRATLVTTPLAIRLNGQSEGTRIYHGRVVVTRGLRY